MQVEPQRTDSELVCAARGGDTLAYRHLVERHEQRVFRFLTKHVGRADEAEDLTQETFLQAFRSLANYRGEGKFTTWLIGIALNVARNHANRHASTDASLDDIVLDGLTGADDPAETAAWMAKLRAVQRAVGELPAEQRECVSLVLFEGISYDEASRILALPMGTVKSRLARARARLALVLKDY